eukprot:gnl/TRDRNA2_/TRDRNA2_188421_c0_seq1.p1 gnl/TRDRNA2_/TRDRNA2_188421_c0~~gnl/TRDRNA2_/TRDRNA2_188421_c0_seq1.p1  ORF type:complete len:203 (+),score=53.52 gnl/TRDRNA2_/TRDRNA2_188421_c0_seq1:128-736(+)
MMLQERSTFDGKALLILLGFGFVALLMLPHAYTGKEPMVTMASVRSHGYAAQAPSTIARSIQPARAWWAQARRPALVGQPRQPAKVFALTSPEDEYHSVAKRESQLELSSARSSKQRREMLAAALGFALAAAANDQAAVAADAPKEGDVNAPPWVLPVAALGTVLTAAVPILLKPGEEALEQQIEREKKVGVGFQNKNNKFR